MRVDAHQHFWRYDTAAYPWIDDTMGVLRRDFLPLDLAPQRAVCGIDATIAVQARTSLEETRFLLELAADDDSIAGVVGWADLCAPDIEAQLAHLAAAQRIVGLRHVVQDEPDDAFLARPDFRRGIAALARHGWVYDLLLHPRHLRHAADLAAAFPGQPFVLDHLAKPFIARGELEPWATDLAALAAHDNVSCKLSGLVTEATWDTWESSEIEPYMDIAFGVFGEERLLFGSDWPVALLAADYSAVHALVDDYTRTRLDTRGQARVFGENATRIYSL